MPLIVIIIALVALKYFEVRFFTTLSWWWVVGLAVAAFLWFEFFERMLGLDKRRAFEQLDKAREDRVKAMFKKK
ncbi:MAG: hypothetical protein NVSMB6_29610 [Burkholderiaceae bacterium]